MFFLSLFTVCVCRAVLNDILLILYFKLSSQEQSGGSQTGDVSRNSIYYGITVHWFTSMFHVRHMSLRLSVPFYTV